MPSLLLIYGFRFFFYSNESNEPAHVHVEKGEGVAKIWLEPIIEPAYFKNLSGKEQRLILDIVEENAGLFKTKWYEYFSK